jgi:HEAT repeat protein
MYGQPPTSEAHKRTSVRRTALERAGLERAVEAAMLGLGRRLDRNATRELVARVESDTDARVRSAALAALVRAAPKVSARAAWKRATRDSDPAVRRRCAELAPLLDTRATRTTMVDHLLVLLADDDPFVDEAAAFALGELAAPDGRALPALTRTATDHTDPLVREAAVAALGAIGDPATLPAVLAATRDKPAVRRRAVLALAAFEGDEVEAAIHRALTDTDWQVRHAAEDLTSEALRPSGS